MKLALQKQFITPLLILTLLIGLLPMNISYAASITLENSLETKTRTNPLQVFSPNMTISGYVNGASPSDVKCEVTQDSSGTGGTIGSSPQVSGNQFTFNGVTLYPGLNKIRLYLSGTEKSFWVYYVDSPSISNLRVLDPNGQYKPLTNFVPADPFTSGSFTQNTFDKVMEVFPGSVNIEGETRNVEKVYVNGVETTSPPTSGKFYHNAAVNGIYKGNHKLTITGENENGGTFEIPFNLAVENGEPTFLNVAVQDNAGATQYLDSSKMVDFNLPSNSTNAQDKEIRLGMDLYFNSQSSLFSNFGSFKVSLKNKSGFEVDKIEVNSNALPSTSSSDFIKALDINGNEKYRVFRLKETMINNLAPGEYTLEFTAFDNSVAKIAYATQKYTFKYVNPSIGYIQDVMIESNNASLEDSPYITSTSDALKVIANSIVDKVAFTSELNGTTYDPTGQGDISNNNPAKFSPNDRIPLSHLQPGLQIFKFVPLNSSGVAIGDPVVIQVNVVLTPSLEIIGMVNNQQFTTTKPGDLTIKYLNLNSIPDRAKTKITLNGHDITSGNYNQYIDGSTASPLEEDSFVLEGGLFDAYVHGTTDNILILGANTLTFTTYSGGTSTSITLKFYYLPDNTPSIGTLTPESAEEDPTPDPSPFRKDPKQPGTYYTSEKHVRLKGTIQNNLALAIILKKNGTEIARLYRDDTSDNWTSDQNFFDAENIEDKDDNNKIIGVEFETILRNSTNPFRIGNEMSLLTKDPYGKTIWNGTTVYTVEAYGNYNPASKSVDYPVASTTITIIREMAPYEFTGRAKMIVEDQKGVTDDNFFPFDIYTEAADEVIVNKLKAKKIDDDNVDGKLRYAVDVPLKPGTNKLKIEIKRGEQTVEDEVIITYANVPIQGSLFRVTLGKSTKFKVFDKKVELEFDKGTMLKTADARDNFNMLLNETPVLFGIADPEMGVVSKDELDSSKKNILRNLIQIPSNYMLTDNVYWIDAGTSRYPGGMTPLEDADKDGSYSSDDSTIIYRSSNQEENLLPTKEGTLKIQYNPSMRMDLARRVTMMYHDGVRWQNIGGKVDAKNNIIEVPFRKFGYYAVMREKEAYQDIAGHPWAKEQLELLSARNWMQPSGDSSINFGAYDTATRGEFATILVKVFNIPLNYEGESTFLDVPKGMKTDLYDQKYIETAFRVGIISGKAVGVFDPQGTLMRQDAAVMIARAANYKLNEFEKAQKTMVKAFVDQEQINRYAVPSVEIVFKKKVMQGLPIDENPKNKMSRFAPYTPLTRDQVAVITYALLKDQKLVK